MAPTVFVSHCDEIESARQGLETASPKSLRLGVWRKRSICWTAFDSFDWRLFNVDSALILDERAAENAANLRWESLATGANRRVMRVELPMPIRVSDFPPGPFRDELRAVLEARVVSPLVTMRGEAWTATIRDRSDGEVAQITLFDGVVERPDGPSPKPIHFIRCDPLGVSDASWPKIEEWVGPGVSLRGAFRQWAQEVGLEAGAYSSKIRLPLTSDMDNHQAAVVILRSLEDVMNANYQGVLDDVDPEFLHDFRVAVRRTRSALSYIRDLYPKSAMRPFREAFSWLGKMTGAVRDLDVYLLGLHEHIKHFDQDIAAQLGVYIRYVEEKRAHQQVLMVEQLLSRRFLDHRDRWQLAVNGGLDVYAIGPLAHQPVLESASAWIWKAYGKVVKKGSELGLHSHARELHRLRILCKKLRYLMEFYRELYEADRIKPLIAGVKAVLSLLGEYNDASVQRNVIQEDARAIVERPFAAETLLALGHLDAELRSNHKALRRGFTECWRKFYTRENRKGFKHLFFERGSLRRAE